MRRLPRSLPSVASVVFGAVALVACGEQTSPRAQLPPSVNPTNAQPATPTRAGSDGPGAASAQPTAAAAGTASAKPGEPAPYDGPYLGATVHQALVLSDMEWPAAEGKRSGGDRDRVVRLGYLRHGGKTPVIPQPHKKSNCAEGWYELVAGGFVCGKYATLDLNHPRFRQAHPPDPNGLVPYTYGVNNANGTPLYRQVPTREERLRYEPWLAKPKKARARPAAKGEPSAPAEPESDNPYADQADAGAPEAPAQDPSLPWYLREQDAGAPQITLDELREEGGPAAKRMVKGFFLSLDHTFSANGMTWWKLNDGLIAPADRIWVTKPQTDFHGVWLGEDSKGTYPTHPGAQPRKVLKLPVGFLTARSPHKYLVDPAKKKFSQGGRLDHFTTVQLTGKTCEIGGNVFDETDEGWWMKSTDGTKTEPGPAPEKLAANERWIDVNLARQTLVAFEGDRPVFATIISSGRAGHTTPTGSYRIREKHVAATMDGDAEAGASDGPYSIQDVPYIMYFSGGFALHGAFWHASFGGVKSHGCVNLAPADARAVFGWAEPQLPEGWHGVNATKDRPGSRVVLHN